MIDQAQSLRTLAASVNESDRLDALLYDEPVRQSSGKCTAVTVASGKGGVGKTNISINLAIMLSKLNKSVTLFDADLGLANINILLGIHPSFTLQDVTEGRAKIGDVAMRGPGGITIVPGGSGVESLANIDAGSLKRLLREFSALETSSDYLIFDTQAGIAHTVRAFAAASDRQIVVVTPEPSSLADAYAAMKMMAVAGCSKIGIVANMVRDDKEGLDVYKRLATLAKRFLGREPEFLGALPRDPKVSSSVIRQTPITLAHPDAPFSKSMHRIALKFVGQPVTVGKESVFGKLASIFRKA
ncbi:MAG: MinD/ParA family protein [Fibrobacteres bacterium]|nr:MinD/ParA family protein [Fibrobacterota bacterium]